MYSAGEILRAMREPQRAARELNRWYWRLQGDDDYNTTGVEIFEEDWDNLVILDGCRTDYLRETIDQYDIPADSGSRSSRGSKTAEWLRGNFDGQDLRDTVYVTASTMLYQENAFKERVDVELHDFIDVWANSIDYGEDGVPPESVAKRTREAAEKYPHKRIVSHFVQPHAPYIGPKGQEHFPDFEPNPLGNRFHGDIDTPDEVFEEVYQENLELALDAVEDLLPDLEGKTVITADHGMLIGERERPIPVKSYGHPGNIHVDELVEVPWYTLENGERREIVAEGEGVKYAQKQTAELDDRAREHLEQMGYL